MVNTNGIFHWFQQKSPKGISRSVAVFEDIFGKRFIERIKKLFCTLAHFPDLV